MIYSELVLFDKNVLITFFMTDIEGLFGGAGIATAIYLDESNSLNYRIIRVLCT